MNRLAAIIEELKDHTIDDRVGLYEVMVEAEEASGVTSPAEIKERTLFLVAEMLKHGFIACDSPYRNPKADPWPNQDHAYVLGRISKEWDELGELPNIPDIACFDHPDGPISHLRGPRKGRKA